MNDEYLWNREGEPDPEVARLEKLLAPVAYDPAAHKASYHRPSRRSLAIPVAIAAGLAVFGLFRAAKPPVMPETGWTVSMGGSEARAVRQGEWLATPAGATASVESSSVGELTIEPNSRLRLVESQDRRQRFDLQRGVIHALIWAPPAQFAVDTPSARTVDLGCRYTLEMTESGEGRLSVQLGWVAFQAGNRESFIPAGATCLTQPKTGPGTPFFDDADARLIQGLAQFDGRGDSLETILGSARARDALTLWHLLSRTRGEDRQRVYMRLAGLVKLPDAANESAVLKGDRAALDAAWNALDLGDTAWWRTWKRNW